MTSCERFRDLLLEGDPVSMEEATNHAAGCAGCARDLASWNEIATTARSLRTTWQSDLLWPRIERGLQRAAPPRRRIAAVSAIAATVLLTLGLAIAAWFGLRARSDRAAFDRVILREHALEDVESAERAHVEAIGKLEEIAAPGLESPASPLMVSYREKLMLLDDAIQECQTSIRQNRQNAHLRRQLLAVYSEKQRTLEDVLQEETSHASNQ